MLPPISCPTLANPDTDRRQQRRRQRGIRLRAGTQAKIYNALVTGKANNLTTETEQTEKFLIDGPSVLNYIAIAGDIKASGDGGYSSALFTAEGNHNAINQTLNFSNIFIGTQDGGADLSADSFFEKRLIKVQ